MGPANSNFIALVVYKALALVVGLAFAWMGYRLFTLGIAEKSGDLELKGGTLFGIKVTRAAPGTFFAVLGAAIVIYAVTQILQFSQTRETTPTPGRTTIQTSPSKDSTRPSPNTSGITTTTICDTCSASTSPAHTGLGTTICDTCKSPPSPRLLPRHKTLPPKP